MGGFFCVGDKKALRFVGDNTNKVQKGFRLFGWYRIVVGIVLLVLYSVGQFS